jgi:hypothetical protein
MGSFFPLSAVGGLPGIAGLREKEIYAYMEHDVS